MHRCAAHGAAIRGQRRHHDCTDAAPRRKGESRMVTLRTTLALVSLLVLVPPSAARAAVTTELLGWD
jgi:hypothetical protein